MIFSKNEGKVLINGKSLVQNSIKVDKNTLQNKFLSGPKMMPCQLHGSSLSMLDNLNLSS